MDGKTMNSKNFKCLGLSILEALVATVIVGIGFVAVFQMVNYSAVSINTSAERTKTNFLIDMIVEDLVSEQDTIAGDNRKLHAIDSFTEKRELLNIINCERYEGDGSMYPTISDDGVVLGTSPDKKQAKWRHLIATDNAIKCRSEKDTRSVQVFKIRPVGTLDEVFFGKVEIKMNNGNKVKYLYFPISQEMGK